MKRSRRLLLLAPLAGFWLAGISSFEALFAPNKRLWEKWLATNAYSTAVIDHAPWDGLLKRYLRPGEDGLNRFAYGAVTAEDREILEAHLQAMTSLPIGRYHRREQLAYWINLYNLLTVKVVLDHYPVASIRDIDISPGLFGDGPWEKKLITISGEEVSLNDIEHRILRPIWSDPRIHYAVNCAAVGCPNLRGEAYRGAAVERQLTDAAKAFINSPRALWWTQDGFAVSSIYAWFQEDFGGSDSGILTHLGDYAADDLRQRIGRVVEIVDHDYDWSLNDAK